MKKIKLLISSITMMFMALMMIAFWAPNVQAAEGSITVGVKGYYIANAQAALDRINEIRKEACDQGVIDSTTGQPLKSTDYVPLQWSADMEEIARIRAREASINLSHTRPNGEDCFSLKSSNGTQSYSENLAWNRSEDVKEGIEQWYAEKTDWEKQTGKVTGHYTSLINPNYRYIALGCFYSQDAKYPNTLASEMAYSDKSSTEPAKGTGEQFWPVEVSAERLEGIRIKNLADEQIAELALKENESADLQARANLTMEKSGASYSYYGLATLINPAVTWTSDSPEVAEVSAEGRITAKAAGFAVITAACAGKTSCLNLTVTAAETNPEETQPEESYTVTFNANGGQFRHGFLNGNTDKWEYYYTSDPIECSYAKGEYISRYSISVYPKRDGKILAGWAVSKDSTTSVLDDDYVVEKSVILYAIWKDAVTISYHPNGGTITFFEDYEEDQYKDLDCVKEQYAVGDSFYSPYLGLTRDGKVFSGWALTDDSKEDYFEHGRTAEKDLDLYAIWKDEFTLTLHANGGKIDGQDEKCYTYTEGEMINAWRISTAYKEGYVFLGYALSQDAVDPDFYPRREEDDSTTWVIDENTEMYAVWEKGVEITLDANGGTFDDGGDVCTKYARKGYRFNDFEPPSNGDKLLLGWSLTQGEDAKVIDYYAAFEKATLYAVWADKVTVTFDGNGGCFFSEPDEVIYTQEKARNTIIYYCNEEVSKSGKYFVGWSTSKTGETNELADGYTLTEDVTFYAVWSDSNTDPNAVTVTLDPKGGYYEKWNADIEGYEKSYEPEIVQLYKGEVIYSDYFMISSFKNDGDKVLLGWSLKENATKADILNNYEIKESVRLYAVWEDAVKIIFDPNGGYHEEWDNDAEENVKCYESYDELMAKGESLEKADNMKYYFDNGEDKKLIGWSLDPNATKADILTDYVINDSVRLYAVWEDTVTITLDANGGYFGSNEENTTRSLKACAGETLIIDRDDYEYSPYKGEDHYYFAGWSDQRDGETDILEAGFTIPDHSITFYAIWKKQQSVSLDPNGGRYQGSKNPYKLSVYGDTTIDLIYEFRIKPTWDGHTFLGWAKDKYASAEDVIGNDEKITEDITLYAIWSEQRSYKVTFVHNGGYISDLYDEYDSTTKEYVSGSVIHEMGYAMHKDGYTFAGWEDEDGNLILPADGSGSYTVDRRTTFYAQWKEAADVEEPHEHVWDDGVVTKEATTLNFQPKVALKAF